MVCASQEKLTDFPWHVSLTSFNPCFSQTLVPATVTVNRYVARSCDCDYGQTRVLLADSVAPAVNCLQSPRYTVLNRHKAKACPLFLNQGRGSCSAGNGLCMRTEVLCYEVK